MITRKDLETVLPAVGFNLWQAERDYLQHLILMLLSRRIGNDLVFKGGTALQKALALNRFSIDLDFNLSGAQDPVLNAAARISGDIPLFGYGASWKKKPGRTSMTISFTVQGPLYTGRPSSAAVIRLEISSREKVELRPKRSEITPLYTDLPPYTALVMDPREILAEKVRAILTRARPRDLYDAKFILDKGFRPDMGLIDRKLSYYGMTFSLQKFEQAVAFQKPLWEKEMKLLLAAAPPPFKSVSRSLIESFKT